MFRGGPRKQDVVAIDRKSTRLNSSHVSISYAVFCLNATAPPELYALSLHDALPISVHHRGPLTPIPSGPLCARVRAGALTTHFRARLSDHTRERDDQGWPVVDVPRRAAQTGRCRYRSEEHTSELQSRFDLVCRLLLECDRPPRALRSFPTRRSSDLGTPPGSSNTNTVWPPLRASSSGRTDHALSSSSFRPHS